jgi:hypothetical protein
MKRLSPAAEKLRRRKDLFIPLMTEYYDAFDRGDKTSELRVYGARWNERTCDPGRMVTISKGYGKKHRRRGVVTQIDIVKALDLPVRQRNSVLKLFKHLDHLIIIIHIELLPRLL